MKILRKTSYIIVVCICVIYYLMFFSTYEVKYDLTDCVRYFDDDGRYRLMLVADTYFFVDAKKEYEQKANVIQYYYDDDIFYGMCFFKNQTTYFVFNIKTGEMNEYFDTDLLSIKEASIFNSDNMIQLDKPNKYQKYFRKFIPLKYRKK